MTRPSVVFPNLRHIFQELCRKLPGTSGNFRELPGTSCIISGSIAFYSTVTDFARFRG